MAGMEPNPYQSPEIPPEQSWWSVDRKVNFAFFICNLLVLVVSSLFLTTAQTERQWCIGLAVVIISAVSSVRLLVPRF